jgi:DNA-binding transcriptional MerR regulator
LTKRLGLLPMKLTPTQLREVIGLSQETLRYWRKELQPLRGRQGSSPSYAPGEALALRVVKELVDMGVKIQAVKSMAEDLFAICLQPNWTHLEQCCLLFEPPSGWVSIEDEPLQLGRPSGPLMIVPLRSHISALQRQLLGAPLHGQRELKFPPLGLNQRVVGEE